METSRLRAIGNHPTVQLPYFKKNISKSIQSIKQNNLQNQYRAIRNSQLPRQRILRPLDFKNIKLKNRHDSLTNLNRYKKSYNSVHEDYTDSVHNSKLQELNNKFIKNQLFYKRNKKFKTNGQQKKRKNKILTETSNQNNEKHLNQLIKEKNISKKMKQQKTKYQITLRQHQSKMNSIYKNHIQSRLKYDHININKIRQSLDQDINIKLQFKSRKKIFFKQEIKHQHKVKKQLINENNSNDMFMKQNNLFNIQIESTKCYDSLFPLFRNGSTLVAYGEKNIYLYGGVSTKMVDSYYFHQYIQAESKWETVQNQWNKPEIILSYHTVETYKHYLIFIGGTYLDSTNFKDIHKFNSNLLVFNTQSKAWQQIKWQKSLKSHSSTIYGNMLVVYGGINSKGKYSNKLYFLPLNHNNIMESKTTPYNISSEQVQGLAYHKLINTFQLDLTYKNKHNLDGIICYGGKYESGKLNQELRLFRFHNKNHDNNIQGRQRLTRQWQVIQTKGIRPQARYKHSMNILNNKNIVFVIGGLNEKDHVLNDAWIFDLNNMTWINAIFDSYYPILENGIYHHTTTVLNNQIFVFGGMNQQNRHNNQFWSIYFSFNRALKKQESMRKTRQNIGSTCKINKQVSLFQDPSQI